MIAALKQAFKEAAAEIGVALASIAAALIGLAYDLAFIATIAIVQLFRR